MFTKPAEQPKWEKETSMNIVEFDKLRERLAGLEAKNHYTETRLTNLERDSDTLIKEVRHLKNQDESACESEHKTEEVHKLEDIRGERDMLWNTLVDIAASINRIIG